MAPAKLKRCPCCGIWQAPALPLHDVIVADHARVDEAADAVQILRGGAPCGVHFAGPASEAAVLIGHENAQHGVGGIQMASLSQTKFAAEAVLEHATEEFDAAFGLRTAGGDEVWRTPSPP